MNEDTDEVGAVITDERIEKMRVRIGVPMEMPPPFNSEAHPDTMRHYCYGVGDDNPLYFDAAHGSATRWGTTIGAPMYVHTLGRSEAGPMPKDIRERSKGAFAGIGEYYAGSEWTFHRPVVPGDRVRAHQCITGISDQPSKTFESRRVRSDRVVEYTRESDEAPLAEHQMYFFLIERSATQRTAEKRKVEPPSYTDDEIEEIEAAILGERRRGAEPRYLEDVSVGDRLGGLTKGPLRVSDVLAWHIGNGPGSTGWGAFRIMSQTRERVPGFFTKNEYGAWDLVQRLHWDVQWANRIGIDRSYDYGPMRNTWMAQLCTDWMGDDAWLRSLKTQIRGFNYQGDVTRLSGEVAAVGDATVTVRIEGHNQRGDVSCTGEAEIALPTRGQTSLVPTVERT